MSNGKYLLSDHDLPFSGPFGLTSFIIDFLLSPAELQVVDETGLRTGHFGTQILSEIPDSHPCFLAKGTFMLPANRALTRRIIGKGTGKYTFNSITPDNTSIVLEDVATAIGQEDVLAVNADGTQIRFTPAVEKPFTLTLGRQVDQHARGIAVTGLAGGPIADVDITISPDLSIVRVGNRSRENTVGVRVFDIDSKTRAHTKLDRTGVRLPTNHDLVVAVTDWVDMEMAVRTVPFE